MENIIQMSFVHKLWYLANKEDVLFVEWIENEDAIIINMILLENYLYSYDTIFPNQTTSSFSDSLIRYGFDGMIIKSRFGQNIKFRNKNFTRDGQNLDIIVNSYGNKPIVDCERHNLCESEYQGNDAAKCQFSEEQLKEFFGEHYSLVQKNEIKISSEQMLCPVKKEIEHIEIEDDDTYDSPFSDLVENHTYFATTAIKTEKNVQQDLD
ncbi:uncharacterized protein LOC119683892 [Teleopsis dalmanni]|uniref:uncharacterized protein LOC119683892 n=1 Tax=Teleopsis dalmanni TaxID=139649 RepID=UPI000D329EBC|nr:uncharacterized protein LOC119683892 [Teleopsis dalmanni]